MKWIFNNSGATLIVFGSVINDQTFYQIEQKELLRWQTSSDVEDSIISGDFVMSFDGVNLIDDSTAGVAFLRSFSSYPSTYAVDKFDAENDLPVDQVVTTTDPTLIDAERKLWDLLNDFDISTSSFAPKLDGVWNLNGTVTLKDLENVQKISICIFRNDALWFIAAERDVGLDPTLSMAFSCDIDAYASYSHVFDLRIALTKIVELDPISATISGLEEETAWGMTFLQVLRQTSPT